MLARLTGQRRRPRRSSPLAQQALVPVSILRTPLHDSPSLQGRIVSDINSLVEMHTSSNDHVLHHRPASPAPPSPEFVALQPRKRPPPGRNDTIDDSLTLSSEGTVDPPPPQRNPTRTIPSPSSGADNGWSTFGRARAKPTPAVDRPSPGRLASPSRTDSQHRHRGGDIQPTTPTSTSLSSYATPPTQTDHAHTPSNHTFGKPTPPSSGFTFRSRHSSSPFPQRAIVPPLPPLDHPAFLFPLPPSLTGRPERRFPSSEVLQGLEDDRRPRPSTSLPILSQQRDRTTSVFRLRRGSALGEPRFRRKTTLGNAVKLRSILPSMEIPTAAIINAAEHPDGQTRKRTTSKSSKRSRNSSRNSSRRSSAEFSAMKVSALGSESWETQVAMEMVRVSLGAASGQASANEAKSGEARGYNVLVSSPSATSLELGSPFLLQDIHTHSFPNSLHHHHPITHAAYEQHKNDLEKVGGKVSGKGKDDAIVMSHEMDTPTPSPTKGKEKERTFPHASSHSQRRASRRSSTDRSRLSGTALATIPTGPTPDSSFMRPPVISLTGPTSAPSSSTLQPPQSGQVLHHQKSATEPLMSVLKNASTSPVVAPPLIQKSYSGGKRKLDEAGVDREVTPLKEHYRTTTFAVGPRPHRASERSAYSSLAPSSYHRKRARLSSDAKPSSRPASRLEEANAPNAGTWSSRSSIVTGRAPPSSSPSKSVSHRHSRPSSIHQGQAAPSRRSFSQVSQVSLPISALVSPHAPSVSRSSQYHMRDPRRPAPVQPTGWSLSFPIAMADVEGQGQTAWALDGWVERGGSPLHAWLFFVGFVLFPMWWIASFFKIRKTRRLDAATGIGAQTGKAEKGTMLLDDPQLEHDANSWRKRCRVMAVVSLVTYIPFIILIAIFAR